MTNSLLLIFFVAVIFSSPRTAWSDSHSSHKNESSPPRHQRDHEKPRDSELPRLFTNEPGDLTELERNEVQALSNQIRQAAEKPAKRGENLSEFFNWDQKNHAVAQLQKKLLEKLQKREPKADAQTARDELEALMKICKDRKSAAWAKWIRPW